MKARQQAQGYQMNQNQGQRSHITVRTRAIKSKDNQLKVKGFHNQARTKKKGLTRAKSQNQG